MGPAFQVGVGCQENVIRKFIIFNIMCYTLEVRKTTTNTGATGLGGRDYQGWSVKE